MESVLYILAFLHIVNSNLVISATRSSENHSTLKYRKLIPIKNDHPIREVPSHESFESDYRYNGSNCDWAKENVDDRKFEEGRFRKHFSEFSLPGVKRVF